MTVEPGATCSPFDTASPSGSPRAVARAAYEEAGIEPELIPIAVEELLRAYSPVTMAREVVKAEEIVDYTPKDNVAERLASYNMLAVGVTDEAERLLGAITVDDVLDRTLPTGWRQRRRVAAFTGTAPPPRAPGAP